MKIDKNFVDGETLYAEDINEIVDAVNDLDESLEKKVEQVSGKGLSTNDFTNAEKEKLSKIEAGAQVNIVTSVAGRKGAVTLTKTDVGLSNVDNTSDENKPVSTAAKELFVAKEEGKSLSDNNFSNFYKDKLNRAPEFTTTGEGNMFLADDGTYKKSAGVGGGFYDVSKQHPLESGFYSKETAVVALKDADIDDEYKPGLIITFELSQGEWKEYRFEGTSIDSFLEPSAWAEYGGGSIKTITVNGDKQTPDSTGNITINYDQIEVDDTLDSNSTNPVENRVITEKMSELEASTVFGMNAEVDEESNIVRLSINNKSGAEIAAAEIPIASGGEGDGAATKIILNTYVDKSIVKEGDSAELSYFYDHQYMSGDDAGISTGQKAAVTVTLKRGTTTLYEYTYYDISQGTYQIPLDNYLSVGTIDLYVKAEVVDPVTGSTQRKQAYTTVKVISLSLSSSYDLSSNLAGYGEADTLYIPYTISGTGTKEVILYLDGKEYDTKTVTKSGQVNGSFNIPMTGLSYGRHNVQMIAEMEASEELTIQSESIYIDFYKKGAPTGEIVFIGAKFSSSEGIIFDQLQYLSPTLQVGRYELLAFEFVAYDPTRTPVTMEVYRDGEKTQTISVARTTQTYNNRFTSQGEVDMKFVCGNTQYSFTILVEESSIDIEEVMDGLTLRLMASGRSNSEENPAQWNYKDISTKFEGFDWDSNGWINDRLRLTNRANIEIDYKPFSTDASGTGATYEIELECSNVIERNGVIIDCVSNNVGFRMTTQEAFMLSSGGDKVSTLFAPMNIKVAFVVEPKSANRLMHLYVNGIRCGIEQYSDNDSFLQSAPVNIRILSDSADVDIRSIRIYNKALSDDDVLNNFIVDRPDPDEMILLFNNNEVLGDDGKVDIDIIRAKGKSVMRVVGDVNLVNQTNDKKFERPVDIYFYSAYGKEYDFIARQVGLRIQGTSSTTYPRKNYRLYFDRASKYEGCSLEVNGVEIPDFKYAFKPNAIPIDIFCMKADFAESSSTHNTGTAVLINDVWKKCNILTPPQQVDERVRTTVDGLPCDMWYDNDGSNTNVYLGKYNFNNEKSGSAIIYGFEGIKGFNDEEALQGKRNKCICLEFLNNSEPLCLFKVEGDFDTYFENKFDDALEFRFPDDTLWNSALEEDKTAIKRLWSWIIDCENNPEKFVNELSAYFNVDNLCAWYLYTDYFMAVDQRAKNMMLATWDGIIWYFLPYDNDTILGVRNDGTLKYDYTITEESYDSEIQSYSFAGHDSTLWKLLRENMSGDLARVAGVIRANMSNNDVLYIYNDFLMGNWPERVYNKDGEYKYITPLVDGVDTGGGNIGRYSYLYSLQGSRYAHRTFTIQNRFALLDAQYVVGGYRGDAFTAYFGHKFGSDNRKVYITSSERYFFGYGYGSGSPQQSGVLANGEDSTIELTLKTDLIVNDPQVFYGASRMKELDLSDLSETLLQTLNLNNCTALEKLTMKSKRDQENTTLNNILLANCKLVREIDMTGVCSGSFSGIDLSSNTRLERFIAGNTSLVGVTFAQGAPLHSIVLPATLKTLELRYLNRLSNDGITLEGTSNLNRLVIDNCTLIDWQDLLNKCTSVNYLRITGVKLEGDGALLRSLMSMGGIDENGATTNTCRLTGTYHLTGYMEDEEYTKVCNHFPEMTIVQPEYTMIEFDDTVADDANISNLDNKTGYKYGNDYIPSAHIKTIMSKRHRCLGKLTEVGEMTIYPLHDSNSNYYADAANISNASPAKLDSTEGDVWMDEPAYWYKGINDYLNNKKYACFSSLSQMPSRPDESLTKVITLEEIMRANYYKNKYKLLSGYSTVTDSYAVDNNYSVCQIDISNYKKIRFPTVLGESLVCSVFADEDDNIVENIIIPTLNSKFENGMYIISEVPQKAKYLFFTIHNNAEFDIVLLSNSDKIEDMEPDWVFHERCLTGVFETTVIGSKLYSAITGGYCVGNLSKSDMEYYANQRHLQLIDYEMHKDVANLFFAHYGRRDSQDQCGYGQNTTNRVIGNTALIGMQDTINQDHAVEYAWYISVNEFGQETLIRTPSSNCLGYENWFGNKAEWVGKVYLPNTPSIDVQKWYIEMPDGSVRKIKSANGSYFYAGIYHEKYMDVIFVGNAIASGTTNYCDHFQGSTGVDRVVYRSTSSHSANGGVSNLNGGQPLATYISPSITGRLAFRGKILEALTVATFKTLTAKA